MRGFWNRYCRSLHRRSARIAPALSRLTTALCIGWAGLFLMAAAFRVIASPAMLPGALAQVIAVYTAIALAPLAGYTVASRGFSGSLPQLTLRLPPIIGRWRTLRADDARQHPLFGPAGFMASLLVGLLLNVVLRSLEFLLAIPAIGAGGPQWGEALFLLMAADVGLMAFVYMVCFAFALRNVPLFPRMLLFAWVLDVFLQLFIAHRLGAMPGLPADVAAPLAVLLDGNIKKVLISAFVWLPWLILSVRANVTFRHRAPATAGE
ncbi:DUF2569 domain-containing protein [Altererythrobacter aerius]|uniref:DUF2569 domain-containing protein n=1 Tax=Tsuneonella aeria TaxID=1837929 RepID=A0A6I4TGR7_9SPHN|nr:DUF2569 domain-containing protein [Tsuneonella aeria]MXO75230.1 DUF2569 domain-containing protein [Tsuneonella aeria]